MRRAKPSKYVFEPKVPHHQDLVEVEAQPIEKHPVPTKMDGKYMPKPAESDMSAPFDFVKQDGFLFSAPDFAEDTKLVVYEDGSCGLRIGNNVFPVVTRFVGETLAVEHMDSAHMVGEARFQLSPQTHQ